MAPMYWETILLKQAKKRKFQIEQYELTGVEIELPCPLVTGEYSYIGIDPGINYGITFLDKKGITILWGKLPKIHKLRGMDAQILAERISKNFNGLYWSLYFGNLPKVYIEGPAYSMNVGQPLLEQVRYGFATGFISSGCAVEYIPPNKARKLAFGSAKIAGKDVWVNINQNGADSIGLAIAGAMLDNQVSPP